MMRFAKPSPVSLFAACAVMLLPLSAGAASQCKGMALDQCAGANECRWVDAYVRKDGREVSGYCRSAPAQRPELGGGPGAVKTKAVD